MLYLIIVAATIIVLGIVWKIRSSKFSKFPPGPVGIPLMGNLIQLGMTPHVTFMEWSKKYGSIIGVRMGQYQAVCFNDSKTIKEAFNEPAFSGRPDNEAFNFFAGGKFGVINSDSSTWNEQRKFTIRALREFGFGKKSMENLIMDDVNEFLDWISSQKSGEAVYVRRIMQIAIFNSLWMIISGKRFRIDDPKLTEILDQQAKIGKELTETGYLMFFPKLSQYFPGISGWNKMVKVIQPMTDLFHEAVEEHHKTFSSGVCRDFIDSYLKEIENTKDPESTFYKGKISDKNLKAVVGDLFVAGIDTTSATLTWVILYLMTSPEVQKKLQKEIDSVIGKSRPPSLTDKPMMPYTEAVIMESLRLSSIVPLGVFHNTMSDTKFHDYCIPKDTILFANIHAAHHNPDVWEDPEKFCPERFLSNDEKTILKHDSFIPFSTGKRVCPGEPLARNQMFLFLTSLFQKFTATPDPEEPKPSWEPVLRFVLTPHPYKVVFKER